MNKDSDLNTDSNYGGFANSDESLANETTRLLSELDRAIEHSSTLTCSHPSRRLDSSRSGPHSGQASFEKSSATCSPASLVAQC